MKCKCGRQTYDPSGICAICNLKANDPDTIQGSGNSRHKGTKAQRHRSIKTAQRHEGQPKARVEKRNNVSRETHICIRCQNSYNPTSNAQKRCPICKKIHTKEAKKRAKYQKKHRNKTSLQPHAAHKKTHQPSTANCEITGCKNPIKSSGMCNKHYLKHLKLEGRIGIRKTPRNSQVSRKNISAQARGQDAEPESHLTPEPRPQKDVIPAPACSVTRDTLTDNEWDLLFELIDEQLNICFPSQVEDILRLKGKLTKIGRKAGIQSDSNGSLAQMLYASSLLDQQINSALKNGSIDTTIIFNIRFRLGEVARGSIKT